MTLRLHRTMIAHGVTLAVLAAVPSIATAQGLQYAYRAGDTARFIETLEVNGTSTGRGGRLNVAVSRAARITLAFSASDTVRAWYDSLAMESTGPNGTNRAETRSVVRVPFVLRARADGHVSTVFTPAMPNLVRQLAELYPQFDDFLVMLPKESATAGAARTDTLVRREMIGGRQLFIRRIIRSRVERDTVAGTTPAVVIGVQSSLRIEVTSRAPGGNFSTELHLNGTEKGFAVVAKTGELLYRSREGDSKGMTTYTGRGAKVSVQQAYVYRATIRAVGK